MRRHYVKDHQSVRLSYGDDLQFNFAIVEPDPHASFFPRRSRGEHRRLDVVHDVVNVGFAYAVFAS